MATSFEQAIKIWTDIGLNVLQKTLDEQGVQIVENQAGSLKSRKELATKTKEFRKLDDAGKLAEIKTLLKEYQNEVDRLTERGKFAENSFMSVYKALAEAPDPRPLLEASVDSVAAAADAAKLAAENQRLNELIGKRADYETVKAKLLKLEMEMPERVAAKEAELNAVFDERERGWRAREAELEQTVQELRAAASGSGSGSGPADSDGAGGGSRLAELEFVSADLDRANRRAVDAERRNEQLRSELEALKAGRQDQELRDRIAELEGETRTMAARLETARTSQRQDADGAARRAEALERDAQRRADEVAALRARLDAQADYDEIKRELSVLKSIEFRDEDDDAAGAEDSSRGDSTNLEKKLLARNKQLTSEMATLRAQNNELRGQVDNLKANTDTSSAEIERLRALNAKLEDDLTTMNRADGGMSVVSAWTRPAPSTARKAGTATRGGASGRLSPTASIVGGGDTTTTTSGDGQPSADPAILPIVTQQRDRFRSRNVELEEELRKNWLTISSLRNELDRVKKDNMDLYERTRYMSSYAGSSGAPPPVPAAAAASADPENAGVVDRYRDDYEEGITGFQMFRTQEAERLLSRMGPLERVSYTFTRFVMATRQSRKLFFLYTVALHCVLAVVLMYGGVSPAAATAPVAAASVKAAGSIRRDDTPSSA